MSTAEIALKFWANERKRKGKMYQKSIDTSPYDGKCDICQEPIVCEDGPYCHDCEYDLYNWDLDNEGIA